MPGRVMLLHIKRESKIRFRQRHITRITNDINDLNKQREHLFTRFTGVRPDMGIAFNIRFETFYSLSENGADPEETCGIENVHHVDINLLGIT